MFKRLLIAVLLLSPWLGGASCGGADKFRNSKALLGVVDMGPFPKQGPGVGGYNLYMSETKDGKFEKVNEEPLLQYSKIMVPMLTPGQDYFFKMTSVSAKNPAKESVQTAAFRRTAMAKKD